MSHDLDQVYVTGHSLGGALATLAAHDIRSALCALPVKTTVSTYTFGSPRTGNHAFARSCKDVCPDSWSVINDQVGGQWSLQLLL